MSSFEFESVERIAKRICEDRHGAGSWDARHRRRADYRGEAMRQIERARGLALADAFMAIFGLRRVVK